MGRKLFIAGNWKMNHTIAETRQMLAAFRPLVDDVTTVDMAICPSFTSLAAAVDALAGSKVGVGAQNVHWEANGAFTGEIAPGMLLELGVTYAIVGHSERRQFFGETDAGVNQRALAALAAGLLPIVCVGETLEQREAGDTAKVVTGQVRGSLANFTPEQAVTTTLAYEPVWAIGTGKTATPEMAQEVHATIRALLVELFGAAAAAQIRIQYGGSVKPDNVASLMSQEDIDGALVGGASMKADVFSALIHGA